MGYHTVVYLLLFLPAVLVIYQLVPQKKRWIVLLLAGYAFVWMISRKLIIYLWAATVVTHYTAVRLAWTKQLHAAAVRKDPNEKRELGAHYGKKEKWILFLGIGLLLAGLGCAKYYIFFAANMNLFFEKAGLDMQVGTRSLILPVGISFYTLQAIGYMTDVYWNKAEVSPCLGKTALFLAFFPQIMEGPISSYAQTAEQLWAGQPLKTVNLSRGAARILWGMFKKLVIADRVYLFVGAVFDHYENYQGIVVATAAAAYTIQLYMEFSGCMDIVIGSGTLFGVTLPENFRQPFFAVNAADFWRRWHMTLGTWFRTYVFYPVSVSRPVKKWIRLSRKHFSVTVSRLGVLFLTLFPVWLCNGLWHGAEWKYIFYGMYYFVILFLEGSLEPVHERVLKKHSGLRNASLYRFLRILKTWIIICTGELFFRADGFRTGIRMFRSIFREFSVHELWDGTLLNIGMDKADYLVVFAGCLVVAAAESIKEKKLPGSEGVQKQRLPVRWAVYYALILAVVIFGAYGTGYQQVDLIYAGF